MYGAALVSAGMSTSRSAPARDDMSANHQKRYKVRCRHPSQVTYSVTRLSGSTAAPHSRPPSSPNANENFRPLETTTCPHVDRLFRCIHTAIDRHSSHTAAHSRPILSPYSRSNQRPSRQAHAPDHFVKCCALQPKSEPEEDHG